PADPLEQPVRVVAAQAEAAGDAVPGLGLREQVLEPGVRELGCPGFVSPSCERQAAAGVQVADDLERSERRRTPARSLDDTDLPVAKVDVEQGLAHRRSTRIRAPRNVSASIRVETRTDSPRSRRMRAGRLMP